MHKKITQLTGAALAIFSASAFPQSPPSSLTVPTTSISQGTAAYEAQNSLTTGGDTVNISGSASVLFQVLNTTDTSITLLHGFTAAAGSQPTTFKALIGLLASPPAPVNGTQQINTPETIQFQTNNNGGSNLIVGGYVTFLATDGSGAQCPVEFVVGQGGTSTLTLLDSGTSSDGVCTINAGSSISAGSETVTVNLNLTFTYPTPEIYTLTTDAIDTAGNLFPFLAAGTWTVTGPWNFTMTAPSLTSVTVTPTGAQASYNQTFQSINGFNGQVALNYTYNGGSLPAGLSFSLNTLWVSGPTPTSVTVTAASGTPAGTYPITITATAQGLTGTLTQTSSVTVVVTPAPSFTVGGPSEIFLTNNSTPSAFTQTLTGLYGFRSPVSVAITYFEDGNLNVWGNPSVLYAPYNATSWTPDPTTGIVSVTGTVEALPSANPGVYWVHGTATSGSLQYLFTFPIDVSSTVTQTITSNVPGAQITVDNTFCNSPCYFQWGANTAHQLSVSSPQSWSAGTRYLYASWSDGLGQSHSVTVGSSPVTYTAYFTTQYQLTTYASPPSEGTITPSSGSNWYNAGTNVTVSAQPNSGYTFVQFIGEVNGPTDPQSLTMLNPAIVTAVFPAAAPSPAVVISNITHPGTALEEGLLIQAGDVINITITGADPLGAVTYSVAGSGTQYAFPTNPTTDENGYWTMNFPLSPGNAREYTEYWYVNGTNIAPPEADAFAKWAPNLPTFTVYQNYLYTLCSGQSTVNAACGSTTEFGPTNEALHWEHNPVSYYYYDSTFTSSLVEGAANSWSIQTKVDLAPAEFYSSISLNDATPAAGVIRNADTYTYGERCGQCFDKIDECIPGGGACFDGAGVFAAQIDLYTTNIGQAASTAVSLNAIVNPNLTQAQAQSQIAAYTIAHELGHAAMRLYDISPINGACSEAQSIMYGSGSVSYGCGNTATNSACDLSAVNVVYPTEVPQSACYPEIDNCDHLIACQ